MSKLPPEVSIATLADLPSLTTRRLVGYPGAAAVLAVPVGTVKSWVSRGQVPHIRLTPRLVRFDLDELEQWIADRRVSPTPSPRGPLRVIEGGR
jgi:excisionase family DNA binding protein